MCAKRRDIIKSCLAAAAAAGWPGKLLAGPSDDPYLAYVHPQLRAAARAILEMDRGKPPLTMENLTFLRDAMVKSRAPPRAGVPYERKLVPGLAGQGDVPVYVVNAGPGAARPAILHTHGGGFVSGNASSAIRDLQELCWVLDCVAVSVDYRLAPETRYTGSIEDNYAGLKWLHAHAAKLGADPQRIAVMGESAGGGHAALLAITARDRGEVQLVFQCLTYPMLDDRTGSTRAVSPQMGHLIWDAQKNRFGWQSFLGMTPGGLDVPAAAVPARTLDLAGLPPAFIGVGSIDLFCDEDVAYATRLNDASVPTELIVVPGAFHAFDGAGAASEIAKWFVAARLDALRRAFAAA